MAVITQRKPPPMSVELFRRFVEDRADKERWELIDGVAVMMPPPTLAHQRIATNLLLLLHEALRKHDPTLTVFQRGGVEIGPAVENYDPEPDVLVVDADASRDPQKRYADRFYLAAEIVSASDRVHVEKKRGIYRRHDACKCVLTVQQECIEVRVDQRTNSGWSEQVLTGPDDALVLPDFGLRCSVSDLYVGTALQR